VGIFYNKALIDWSAAPCDNVGTVTSDMALLAKNGRRRWPTRRASQPPISPVHMLYTIANHYVSAAAAERLSFSTPTRTRQSTRPASSRPPRPLAQWTKDGYFPAGYQGCPMCKR